MPYNEIILYHAAKKNYNLNDYKLSFFMLFTWGILWERIYIQ